MAQTIGLHLIRSARQLAVALAALAVIVVCVVLDVAALAGGGNAG